jgi:hypothetical protein
MQTFQDTATSQLWAFEDDVVVKEDNEVYSFITANGLMLNTPATLRPYTPPAPTAAQLLAQARSAQIATLYTAYQQAIQRPVSYTSKGGVTKTYQADSGSVSNLQNMLLAFGATQTAPSGFYWVSLDNTQVPFTYADMQGLAQTLGTQGAAAFQHLQTQKAAILAATTVSDVQAVIW